MFSLNMLPRFPKTILITAILAIAFFCLGIAVFAEDNFEVKCQQAIDRTEEDLSQEEKEDYRALLEQCKKYYEEKSEEIAKDIGKTEQEKKTLSNTIYILGNKINNLSYQISQSNIMIKDLGSQIKDTRVSIIQTEAKIGDIKGKLGNLLQLRYEEDQKSTVEILLAEDTLSGFFDNLVALEMLNLKTQELLKNIQDLKFDLETQKDTMGSEKKDLEQLVIIRELQKQDSAVKKTEHESLFVLTEEEYQRYLKEHEETEEKVTKIGALLFELLEVPEGGIKFEDAVKIAKDISRQTGVRAAFSLAIIWQETRIGKLKGGCYLRNTKTGDGVYIKTGNLAPRTMKPTRDVPPFLNIIKELNKAEKLKTDAFHTPVSCCMYQNGKLSGWGGAMGPAQFIPSTWMEYKKEIEKKTGDIPANPWNVRDAFLANSLFLANYGATRKTYDSEWKAAMIYFSGTSRRTAYNGYGFYGDRVMKVVECFQEYITQGSMSVSCAESIF